MKRIYSVLFSIFSIVLFIPSFVNAVQIENTELVEIEKKNLNVIDIQLENRIKVNNKEEAIPKITKIMDDFDAGIIINDFKSSNYVKYVYNAEDVLGEFAPNDKQDLLRRNNSLEIKDLSEIKDLGLLQNNTRLYCTDDCERLIGQLTISLNARISLRNNYSNEIPAGLFVIFITSVFSILIAIVITFEMNHKYQEFAIKKLHGYDTKKLWKQEVIPLWLNQIVMMCITYTVITLIMTQKINVQTIMFIKDGLILSIGLSVLIMAFVSIPILFFVNVDAVEYLKGKTDRKFFLYFNQVVFVLILISTIILSLSLQTHVVSFVSRISNSEQWNRLESYYIVPTYSNGDNFSDGIDENWWVSEMKSFDEFQKDGSILADFNDFIVGDSNADQLNENQKWARINSNYLSFHNIKDCDGNDFKINQDVEEYIILLPNNGKFNEMELINEAYDALGEDSNKIKGVVFDYYDASERFFTHNSKITNNFTNTVSEIPLLVVTEKNGKWFDKTRIVNYINNPFNIKAKNEEEVRNRLYEYGFKDIEFSVISAIDDIYELNKNDI